jgi:hypothetical protein
VSKKVIVTDCRGQSHAYNSTLLKGYHAVTASDGMCVVEKRLFSKPAVVACYPSKCRKGVVHVETTECVPCKALNPTQRL